MCLDDCIRYWGKIVELSYCMCFRMVVLLLEMFMEVVNCLFDVVYELILVFLNGILNFRFDEKGIEF